jgi:TatD DNase family protein
MIAPVRLVDSHAHLDMEEFDPDRDDVVRRAFEAGLDHLLCPLDISSERSIRITQDLTAAFAMIHAAAGLHPHQARLFTPDLIAAVRGLAERNKILAIGEIGLDFHYDFASPDEQKKAFREQLALAQELGLPAIIHSRNAGPEIARVIREEEFSNGGILHCFTEDWDFAKTALDAGFFISFSGLVTFPKSGDLREVARKVPADRILVETDAPYLAPVPHRGKRNEPAFVVETAKLMAQIRDTSFEKISEEILGNFRSLFHIDT